MNLVIDNVEFDLLEKNNNLFLKYEDLKKLFNEQELKSIDLKIWEFDLDEIIDEENKISINNEFYYNINVIILVLDSCNKNVKSIVDAINNSNLTKYMWSYVLDKFFYSNKIENNKNYYLSNFCDLFNSLNKIRNNVNDSKIIVDFNYEESEYYFELLKEIKNSNKFLPNDFGKLKDGVYLDDLLYDSYLDYCENVSSAFNSANLFYMVIKEEPFVSYNFEIASIFAIDNLRKTLGLVNNHDYDNYINPDNDFNVSGCDLMYAYKIIKDNISEDRIKVVKMIEPLFCKAEQETNYELNHLYDNIKLDSSKENIYKYIICFIKNYRGYQGYYEFYESKSNFVYKIHYYGEIFNFKLNISETMSRKNTLVFDADAVAYTEAPSDLVNREEVINELYDEIKYRSYNDIMSNLTNDLKCVLKDYYNNINLEFILKWELKINPDYEW